MKPFVLPSPCGPDRLSRAGLCTRNQNSSGLRTPRLDQAGWLCAQEISRSFLNARRRGGRLSSKTNLLLNLVNHPVRSTRCFAIILDVAATPPDPGGEFAALKNFDFWCKAPARDQSRSCEGCSAERATSLSGGTSQTKSTPAKQITVPARKTVCREAASMC